MNRSGHKHIQKMERTFQIFLSKLDLRSSQTNTKFLIICGHTDEIISNSLGAVAK